MGRQFCYICLNFRCKVIDIFIYSIINLNEVHHEGRSLEELLGLDFEGGNHEIWT